MLAPSIRQKRCQSGELDDLDCLGRTQDLDRHGSLFDIQHEQEPLGLVVIVAHEKFLKEANVKVSFEFQQVNV
jgi:hypothetical protein